MSRALRPHRARRRPDATGDAGFTLMEIIVAIAVLAAIITPLTAAFITMLQRSGEIDAQLARSQDAQRIGAAWARDVQSVEPGGINDTGTCSDPSASVGVEEHLVTFSWDTSSTSGGVSRSASWVAVGSGRDMRLVRRQCENGVPVAQQVLADYIGNPGQAANDVVHGPSAATPLQFCPAVNKGTSTTPRMVSDACTIVVDGAFQYQVTASRRVPERDVAGPSPTTPPPPTITGGSGRNTYVTVSWNPPAAWDPPIDAYRAHVYLDPNGSAVGSVDVDGTSNAATVGGLSNGVAYYVRVQSHNVIGWGELSAAYGPVTPNATVPDPITGVVAVAGTVSAPLTATVSWTLPGNTGGSDLDQIRIVPTPAVGAPLAPTTASGTATSATVNGLAPGTRYTFVVSAHNALGWNNGTASNQVITLPPQPTAVVAAAGDERTNVTFTLAGNGDVALAGSGQKAIRVTATCVSSGGGCVNRQYTFDHTQPGAPNGTWGPFSTYSPTPVVPLVNGLDYTVTVAVKNENGDWGPASAGVVVRPTRIPDTPSAVSIQANGTSGQLAFTIGQPNSGGDPITTYRVVHQSTGRWASVPNAGASTAFTWSPTTPVFTGTLASPSPAAAVTFADFVDQGFKFEACNALGCSAASATWNLAAAGPAPVATTGTAARGTSAQSVVVTYEGSSTTTHLTATRWSFSCGGQNGTATGQSGSATINSVPTGSQTCTITPSNRLASVTNGTPTTATLGGTALSATVDVYGLPGTFSIAVDLPASGTVNNVTVRAAAVPSSGGTSSALTYAAYCSPQTANGAFIATNSVGVSGLSQGTTTTCYLTVRNAAGYERTVSGTKLLQRTAPVIDSILGTRTIVVQESGGQTANSNKYFAVVRVRHDPGINVASLAVSGIPSGGTGGSQSATAMGTTTSGVDVVTRFWVEVKPNNSDWRNFGSTRALTTTVSYTATLNAGGSATSSQSIWVIPEWNSNGNQDFPAAYSHQNSTSGGTRTSGQTIIAGWQCDDNDSNGVWPFTTDDDECDYAYVRIRNLDTGASHQFSGTYNADDGTVRNYTLTLPTVGTGRWAIEAAFCNENNSCPAGAPSGYDNGWQMLGWFDVP